MRNSYSIPAPAFASSNPGMWIRRCAKQAMSQSPCRTFSTTLDDSAVEFQGLGFYLQVASKESRNKGILCRDNIREGLV